MTLHLLPVRTAGAAENMALDFLLLQRYPEASAPRFRHYEWRRAAFTFGYSQKIEFVRASLPVGETFDLCRRPTGGGVVDHRNDWTYALVLPRGHPLYDGRAAQSYRAVHECLAASLRDLGQPADLKMEANPATGNSQPAGVCFQRAEVHDVINRQSGAKIAGAAQKRNKHGLLFQGSIEKSAVGPLDWEEFDARFTTALARACGVDPAATPWPDLHEDEVAGLIEQYSAPEWIEQR
jgi:lipoate-protein ligase A